MKPKRKVCLSFGFYKNILSNRLSHGFFFTSDHEADQSCQWALISKELKEQYPPLACTPVSQQHPLLCTPVSQYPSLAVTPVLQPPPLMPIMGITANPNLALQESEKSALMVESVEEVIVTGTFSL